MNNLIVKPVGKVVFQNEMPLILLEKPYRSALEGLDGFSHIQIFWWFDACDNEASRNVLTLSRSQRRRFFESIRQPASSDSAISTHVTTHRSST